MEMKHGPHIPFANLFLIICSGTDYAKLSLLTGLRELRLDFSSLDYDDYDGDGVYEAFAFVAD